MKKSEDDKERKEAARLAEVLRELVQVNRAVSEAGAAGRAAAEQVRNAELRAKAEAVQPMRHFASPPPTTTDWAALRKPLTAEQVREATQPTQDGPDQSRGPSR